MSEQKHKAEHKTEHKPTHKTEEKPKESPAPPQPGQPGFISVPGKPGGGPAEGIEITK